MRTIFFQSRKSQRKPTIAHVAARENLIAMTLALKHTSHAGVRAAVGDEVINDL